MGECIPGASKEESSEGLEFGANGRGGVGGHSWRCGWQSCGIARRAREQKGLVRRGSQRFQRRAQQQRPDWPPGWWWCYRQERLFCSCLHRSCSVSWLPVSACPLTNGKSGQSSHAHQPARFAGIVFPFAFFFSLAPSLRDHAAHAAEIQPRTRAKVGLGRAAREPKRLRGTTPPRRLDPTPIPPRPPMSGQHPRLWRRKAAFFGRPFAVNVQRCNGSSVAFLFFPRACCRRTSVESMTGKPHPFILFRSRGGEVSRRSVWRDVVF